MTLDKEFEAHRVGYRLMLKCTSVASLRPVPVSEAKLTWFLEDFVCVCLCGVQLCCTSKQWQLHPLYFWLLTGIHVLGIMVRSEIVLPDFRVASNCLFSLCTRMHSSEGVKIQVLANFLDWNKTCCPLLAFSVWSLIFFQSVKKPRDPLKRWTLNFDNGADISKLNYKYITFSRSRTFTHLMGTTGCELRK